MGTNGYSHFEISAISSPSIQKVVQFENRMETVADGWFKYDWSLMVGLYLIDR
jgi:hypothetical protein